jgi:S-adenosylmethionine hydrolase
MPIITLTSDFGADDYLAGAVKGILLNRIPDAQLVDITHSLLPFNDHRASLIIRQTIQYYPPGTFHLILVNLFYEQPDQLLAVKHNDQFLFLADNGLITMILEKSPEQVVGLPVDTNRQRTLIRLTEHFADAIAGLKDGSAFEKIGSPVPTIKGRNFLKPIHGEDYLDVQILYVDVFENVIINLTRTEFEEQRKGRRFKIFFNRYDSIDKISETYSDVSPGDRLAFFNSAGYMELAINRGNAAGMFGLTGFSEKQISKYSQARISYQTVRIFFEE